MKRILLIAVVGLMLASCSFETYQCAAYGHHNMSTRHGSKAQSKYAKGHNSRNVVAAF